MKQIIEEIRLSKDDSFIIKITYAQGTDAIGEYDNVQVSKIKNEIISEEHLSRTSAAVLKCAYDYSKGRHKGNYIFHTSDAPLQWPFYMEVRSRNYREIIDFLENYACYFVYTERKGVYWNPNPTHTHEPTKTQEKTETISEVDDNTLRIGESSPTDEPDDDRPVTPRKLWEAGRRTYLQSTSSSGRFRLLHINKYIMPFYSTEEKLTYSKDVELPVNVTTDESNDELSLREALKTKCGNLYLIGEGGIGKTTAMVSILEQHYKTKKSYTPSDEIPIFVELSRAPKVFGKWYNDSEEMTSWFIRMEICRQLLNCGKLNDISESYLKSLSDEFETNPKIHSPRYLLLLDGLNEVSMNKVTDTNPDHQEDGTAPTGIVRTLIINEINYLLAHCPNVRVMLTSRTNETEINCTQHNIDKLFLTGLKKDDIENYLLSNNISQHETDIITSDKELMKCIRIPLFLTMYTELYNRNGISSRGEILRGFFHERGENIHYCQQNAANKLKYDMYILWFILDFLLPIIGCKMEQSGEFDMSAKEISKIIEPLLKGWKPTLNGAIPTNDNEPYDASVIGDYGKACFDKYSSGRYSVETVAEDILKKGNNMTKVAEYVLECAVDVLRILYRNKNAEYGFVHHHFRDYFAAVHNVNMLRIAVYAKSKNKQTAFESLIPFLSHANHLAKSVFIGEILGEHHNKPINNGGIWSNNVPYHKDDRNLLTCSLDIFRGRFDQDVNYGVFNLVEPIKLVRQDLSGCDFSHLDLKHISFNGIILGHTKLDGANFQGSKIDITNFIHQGHSGWIKCIVSEPKRGNTFLTASHDGTVKEWDRTTWECIFTYKNGGSPIEAIAYAPDGKTFLSGATDGVIKEWCIGVPNSIRTYQGHSTWINRIVYSPDGKSFLSCSRDNTIKEWRIGIQESILTYSGHNNWVTGIAYEPEKGQTFVSCSYDGTVKEWQIGIPKSIRTYQGSGSGLLCVSYNPKGNSFLAGSVDGTICEWQTGKTESIHKYHEHNNKVYCLSYEPQEAQTFISGSNDGIIKEWQIGNQRSICSYTGHKDGRVYTLAYVKNGRMFLSGSHDGVIKEWQIGTTQSIRTYRGHDRWAKVVAYAPDGKKILSGSDDGTIKEWDTATGQNTFTYIGHNLKINSIVFSPDSKSFLSGSSDNTIKHWLIGQSECTKTYRGHLDWVRAIAFSPDGNSFISGSYDNTIREWVIDSSECICIYNGHGGCVYSVAYAPDGKSFISGSFDKTIKEWRIGKCESINTYKGHKDWVMCVAYEPNTGNTFLSSSSDQTIKEWKLGKIESIFSYIGHSNWIKTIAYAPDGNTFISGSKDYSIKKWKIGEKKSIFTFNDHTDNVTCVSYAKNGKTFISGSTDDTIRIWSSETNKCLRVISNYPGLLVMGCDMRNLHQDSIFSDAEKEILRQYGALID